MTVNHFLPTIDENEALKKDNACIQITLGENGGNDVSLDTYKTLKEDYITSIVKLEVPCKTRKEENLLLAGDSDDTYALLSDDDKIQEKIQKCQSTTIDIEDDNHINELSEKFNYLNLPPELQKLLPGIYCGLPNDYVVPTDRKPDWFDRKKLMTGQAFASKYYTSVNVSDMLSLIALFSFRDTLEPLIFTENSGSPFKAFRRYLSTVMRVTSWYEHDIWNKESLGYRNLKAVRALHLNTSKRLNAVPYKNLKNQISLVGSANNPPVWSTKKDLLLEDFQSCCPFKTAKPLDCSGPGKIFISQLDMSITQFAFVGLLVTYPGKFGAGSATVEELEGFLHMWRSIGYLLGIRDEYNFCAGTLEEVVQRCHAVIDYWIKPNFQNITEDWEHMSRCLTEGLTYYSLSVITFEPTFMYLCWVLEISSPRLYKSLTWLEACVFHYIKFTMNFTLRFPGMLLLYNWLLRFALSRANSFSPEHLKELESKKYDYQLGATENHEEDKKSTHGSLLILLCIANLVM